MRTVFFILLISISLYSSQSRYQVWENFKKNFIQKDGRVVDPHNHNITHTESIGYTLYFSYKMDDKEVFNKVYNWSKNNLVKNESGLMGWKWGRDRKKRCWCMLDLTSASDANLWIAYSLYLMYERTGEFSYKKDADSLIDAIKKHQIISVNNETFLLSWEKKLIGSDAIQLNPSYLIFEIFEYMAKKDKDIIWNKLIKSSILLLKKARFSSLELNSDWVIYNLREDRYYLPLKHKLFGYDAIRVPLNIMRSNLPLYEKRALLKPYKNYIDMMPRVPLGVANLETGEISIYNLSFGHLAVYQKIEQIFNIDRTLFRKKLEDRIEDDDDDYYAYSLYLLTIL